VLIVTDVSMHEKDLYHIGLLYATYGVLHSDIGKK